MWKPEDVIDAIIFGSLGGTILAIAITVAYGVIFGG